MIAWLFIGIIILAGYLFIQDYLGEKTVNPEYIIGLATLILAFATFNLAENEIREGNKDRRRLRIKEQLEGLYSPAMACILDFLNIQEHFSFGERREDKRYLGQVSHIYQLMQNIKDKYEFLAEQSLKEQLRNYYVVRKELPLIGEMKKEDELNWNKMLSDIQLCIINEYKKLSNEYSELVNVNRNNNLKTKKEEQVNSQSELRKNKNTTLFARCFFIASFLYILAIISDFSLETWKISNDWWFKVGFGLFSIFLISLLIMLIMKVMPEPFQKALDRMFGIE